MVMSGTSIAVIAVFCEKKYFFRLSGSIMVESKRKTWRIVSTTVSLMY